MQRKPQQGAPIGVQNLSRAPLLGCKTSAGRPYSRLTTSRGPLLNEDHLRKLT